jgi:hypothetical protein
VLKEMTSNDDKRKNLFLAHVTKLVYLYQAAFVIYLPSVMPWLLQAFNDGSSFLCMGSATEHSDDSTFLLNFTDAILYSCWSCVKHYHAPLLACMCRVAIANSSLKLRVLSTCVRLGFACENHEWVVSRISYLHSALLMQEDLPAEMSGVLEWMAAQYETRRIEMNKEDGDPTTPTWFTMGELRS